MSTTHNQVILDAIREGRRRALACSECDAEKEHVDESDDEGDGELVEVPFASEDNDGSPGTGKNGDALGRRRTPAIAIEDDTGRAATEACRILRVGEDPDTAIVAHINAMLDDYSNDVSTCESIDEYTMDEGRVLVRLLYSLCSPNSSPAKAFVQHGFSASLPWHVRSECLRCLWSDITPTGVLQHTINRGDWGVLLKLVEGIEEGATLPPAQVRSAALKVISTHRHVRALPRLTKLCSRYHDNFIAAFDSKTPLPGWFDGLRQIELTRALLGDASCYTTVVMHLYDSTEAERKDAREVLEAIAEDIGGTVEIARRIIMDLELMDRKEQNLPDFVGRPFRNEQRREDDEGEKERAKMVWEYLMKYHWNELILRWASDSVKRAARKI